MRVSLAALAISSANGNEENSSQLPLGRIHRHSRNLQGTGAAATTLGGNATNPAETGATGTAAGPATDDGSNPNIDGTSGPKQLTDAEIKNLYNQLSQKEDKLAKLEEGSEKYKAVEAEIKALQEELVGPESEDEKELKRLDDQLMKFEQEGKDENSDEIKALNKQIEALESKLYGEADRN